MPRDALIAIGGGLLSAVAAVAFFGGSVFSLLFVYFASVPLLMVGLGLGPRAATIAAGAGIFATGLVGGLFPAGVFGLIQALPAWIISRLTILQFASGRSSNAGDEAEDGEDRNDIHWYPPGLALSVIAVLGGLLVTIAALSAGDGGMKEMVETYLGEAFQFMAPAMGDQGKETMVTSLTAFFPGAIGASWVTMVIINAVVAQGILTRSGRNLRPTPAYAEIDLPQWMSWPLIIAAAMALVGSATGAEELGYAAYNVAMVFAVPYFFVGLAVIHTLARRVTTPGMVLVGVYGVIIISMWAALVVAGVGLAEHWIGLRDRHEDEEDKQLPLE